MSPRNALVVSAMVALTSTACQPGGQESASLSQEDVAAITIEPGKFTIEPKNERVVVGKYTLKPNERREISISTSQQIWVGVTVMDFELLQKYETDCAKVQNKEGTRSVKSCSEAATTFEPTNGRIELILENLLNAPLEVSVYKEQYMD